MARLVFRNGPYAGKSLQLPQGKTVVAGRNRDIDLPLPDLKLSRKHCQIASKNGIYYILDLGSTNGTFVNGRRISEETPLAHFDRLVVGDMEIEFQGPELMDDEQTRVGMPDSKKLETVEIQLGKESAGEEPARPGLAGAKPPSQIEIPLPSAGGPAGPAAMPDPNAYLAATSRMDALTEVLAELDKPLPPEPGGAAREEQQAEPPDLLFCDNCDVSIPQLDLDLGEAKEIGGKLVCKECMAEGVTIGPEVPRAAGSGREVGGRGQNVDEVLKGLGEVEEIELNELVQGPSAITDAAMDGLGGDEAGKMAQHSTRKVVSGPVQPRGAFVRKGPPPPRVNPQEVEDLLGDDFEEVLPGVEPGPAPAPRAKSPEDDSDLIEISGG